MGEFFQQHQQCCGGGDEVGNKHIANSDIWVIQ